MYSYLLQAFPLSPHWDGTDSSGPEVNKSWLPPIGYLQGDITQLKLVLEASVQRLSLSARWHV